MFIKGRKQDHRPGPGRPKGSGLNQSCQKWAVQFGFEFLEAVAEGKMNKKFKINFPADIETRVRVAEYLIDRGFGRPSQAVDMTSGGEIVKFTLKMGNGTQA